VWAAGLIDVGRSFTSRRWCVSGSSWHCHVWGRKGRNAAVPKEQRRQDAPPPLAVLIEALLSSVNGVQTMPWQLFRRPWAG